MLGRKGSLGAADPGVGCSEIRDGSKGAQVRCGCERGWKCLEGRASFLDQGCYKDTNLGVIQDDARFELVRKIVTGVERERAVG